MHPRVMHDIFIDNFTAAARHRSEDQVVQDMVNDANDLLALVREDLASEVSVPKCGLVASSNRLLLRLMLAPWTRSSPTSALTSPPGGAEQARELALPGGPACD